MEALAGTWEEWGTREELGSGFTLTSSFMVVAPFFFPPVMRLHMSVWPQPCLLSIKAMALPKGGWTDSLVEILDIPYWLTGLASSGHW